MNEPKPTVRDLTVNKSPVISGSSYTPLHGDRRVRVYVVQEHELSAISLCNLFSTIFISVASVGLTAAVGCCWDALLLPSGQSVSIGSKAFAMVAVVVSVLSAVCAVVCHRSKTSMVDRIKHETNQTPLE